MEGPTFSTDLATPSKSNPAKPSLLTLPTEIVEKIFSFVDSPGLVSLRLVSRSVCAIANRPFAVKKFASSHHVVSRESFETLLAVSAHSFFGAHIKSIMISPYRKVLDRLDPQDVDEDAIVDDLFIQTRGFSELMPKILANVRRHSGSVTIGILEFYGYRAGTHRQRFHGENALDGGMGLVPRPSETLGIVLAKAREAGIEINGLHFNLHVDRRRFFEDVANPKMYKLVTKVLKSRDSPIDLRFTWSDKGLLEYNHLRSHLCFSASSILLDRAYPDVLFVEETVRWLAERSFSNLHLQQLDVDCIQNLEVYFTQSLQTITLKDIRLNSTLFAPSLYGNLFQRLSELPELRHCIFNMLHYSLQYADEIVPPLAINLISGHYRSACESLVLIFPDGKPKVEIQGADVSRQLEDLAAYTAAAEKRKVHEVEAAGRLVDRRVMGADVSTKGNEEDFGRPVGLRIPVVAPPPFVWPR
jgi:hypothetical protein